MPYQLRVLMDMGCLIESDNFLSFSSLVSPIARLLFAQTNETSLSREEPHHDLASPD